MNYILTLILEKNEQEKTISEIKKYLEEKKGRLIDQKTKGDSILALEVEIDPQEVEKLKRKIRGEKKVISYLLEKKVEIKKIKEKVKKTKKPIKKSAPKINKTKKVLASMQEEEKKIKDLDSTLDKILNE
ncbi:hypothetical protein KJ713_00990 [Patescibacteria group bacterium]|nr:hypothetical protein [Patescibacteria group bacterium]